MLDNFNKEDFNEITFDSYKNMNKKFIENSINKEYKKEYNQDIGKTLFDFDESLVDYSNKIEKLKEEIKSKETTPEHKMKLVKEINRINYLKKDKAN